MFTSYETLKLCQILLRHVLLMVLIILSEIAPYGSLIKYGNALWHVLQYARNVSQYIMVQRRRIVTALIKRQVYDQIDG